MRIPITPVALVSILAGVAGRAAAQPATTRLYAEEPTVGLALPTAGLAGEEDALTVTTNPAGTYFLDGFQLALAIAQDGTDDKETRPGAGWGMFAGGPWGGGLLPRLGWGIGLEFLSPPRVALAPDPGTPTRLTNSIAMPLGRHLALGWAWHHFFDEVGLPLRGVDTYDVGLSMRIGAYLAAGAVVRDIGQPQVADTPVERRYELELVGRPVADDRLELGLGGRIGEIRADFLSGEDIDGWLRGSWRVARGVYLRGEVEDRSLIAIEPGASGTTTSTGREWRITGGLDVSFGSLGVATYGSSATARGNTRFAGGELVVRLSEKEVPSLWGRPDRIERIDLRGDLGERELTRLIAHLREIEHDDSVKALVLQLDGLESGWAEIDELRLEIGALRRTGKKVFAYMVAGTTKQYFLASAADKIYVDPIGGIRLAGISSTSLYFKGLFDKVGVLAQFEKIEEFKSAPEAYTRTGPTEPAFTMRNEMFDSIYEHLVAGIAEGRHLDPARVRVLIDDGPYTSGELALKPDLVDLVADPDRVGEEIVRELGASYPVSDGPVERDARWDYPGVAVIYIDGDIIDGKSTTIPILGTKLVGGDTIAAAIAAARASPRVQAIVLRINSPGGSAPASEVISREVFKTRGVKPIICSMGDVAASGGYFSAAGCDVILADPMTITGSIGIFNGKFDFSGLFERLGVTWSSVKRGQMADMESLLKKFNDDELALMKRKLHYYYGRFIQAVAAGRRMTTEQVDQVGRGHVWTGAQAMPIHLIDQYGGIGDAIALAKKRAGIGERDQVRLVLLPNLEAGLIEKLLGDLVATPEARDQAAQRSMLEALLPRGADQLLIRAIPGSVWEEPGVPQARLPFALVDGP